MAGQGGLKTLGRVKRVVKGCLSFVLVNYGGGFWVMDDVGVRFVEMFGGLDWDVEICYSRERKYFFTLNIDTSVRGLPEPIVVSTGNYRTEAACRRGALGCLDAYNEKWRLE